MTCDSRLLCTFAPPLVHDFCGWVTPAGVTELAIQSEHAISAGAWQVEHRDHFDRMRAAHSRVEQVALITQDKACDELGIENVVVTGSE